MPLGGHLPIFRGELSIKVIYRILKNDEKMIKTNTESKKWKHDCTVSVVRPCLRAVGTLWQNMAKKYISDKNKLLSNTMHTLLIEFVNTCVKWTTVITFLTQSQQTLKIQNESILGCFVWKQYIPEVLLYRVFSGERVHVSDCFLHVCNWRWLFGWASWIWPRYTTKRMAERLHWTTESTEDIQPWCFCKKPTSV